MEKTSPHRKAVSTMTGPIILDNERTKYSASSVTGRKVIYSWMTDNMRIAIRDSTTAITFSIDNARVGIGGGWSGRVTTGVTEAQRGGANGWVIWSV
jgi:hypothetical protein